MLKRLFRVMSEITTAGESMVNHEILAEKRKLDVIDTRVKRMKNSRDERRGFSDAAFEETDYYVENYLRKVYPYYFTYTTFCKGRWVGKRLIDVFSAEFQAHSKQEYEKNIEVGNIRINGKIISRDYTFKENDRVTNKVHRHETSVLISPIKIIHSSDDFVVIDKPPSIPVHPCGRYRHNSLLFILAKEYNLKELYSVHRLDRLTSGLLLFARTIKKSQEVNKQIREREVDKEYVCRVEGEFPDGTVTCKERIEVISPKMGISITSPSGKECETEFLKLSYNGKSSVVSCKPLTGRMHQIRVHLQFLGHPIINDPIYNHTGVFGEKKGKNGEFGKSKEQLLKDLLKIHNLNSWLLDDDSPLPKDAGDTENDKAIDSVENKTALSALENYLSDVESLSKKYTKSAEKIKTDLACALCHQRYMDPRPKDLVIFLHALRYKGLDWSFETEMPAWAKESWNIC